jgi:DNA-binding response OmpR family regulator
LISNAIKFSEAGGIISIKIKKQNKSAIITVTDTGRGISRTAMPYVFDRYYQVDTSETKIGSGIGLAIVKKLVTLHEGSITGTSKLGKGTTFEIYFPIKKIGGISSTTPKISDKPIDFKVARVDNEQAEINLKNKTILLVDDNDEIRAFIAMQLRLSYTILEASNGKIGISMAKINQPDLIVSDLMMPIKNGYELCEELKKNILTSHIPIILLTAKSAQEERLKGYETGADDYLTKPFEVRELEVRISNLIKIREELKIRFSKSVEIKPEEVSVNSIDQEFMLKALVIIEKNMDNEGFNVAFFSKEIGISTTQLNLKLKNLIGQSTNQFIKSIRLQRAAALLLNETGTVSEIGFQTGFSSTSYFVRSFKKHFGVSPGTYKNTQV